jgi:hypothetical protein
MYRHWSISYATGAGWICCRETISGIVATYSCVATGDEFVRSSCATLGGISGDSCCAAVAGMFAGLSRRPGGGVPARACSMSIGMVGAFRRLKRAMSPMVESEQSVILHKKSGVWCLLSITIFGSLVIHLLFRGASGLQTSSSLTQSGSRPPP